jgi:hypothetical protein
LDKVLKNLRIPARIQQISLDLGETFTEISEDEDQQMSLYKSQPKYVVEAINTQIKKYSNIYVIVTA